jgi:hypothetical protein
MVTSDAHQESPQNASLGFSIAFSNWAKSIIRTNIQIRVVATTYRGTDKVIR